MILTTTCLLKDVCFIHGINMYDDMKFCEECSQVVDMGKRCFQTGGLLFAVNAKIDSEIKEHEQKYRGRELPGFINYKTFEVMVKEQIKQMEEPAVKKLKDVSGVWLSLSLSFRP